jgi:segregation and condensation protein A
MTEAEQVALTEQTSPSLSLVPPLATVHGQAVNDLPTDLYIPPDAMKVLLDTFEGPLDFLLYLIRKQNLEILDIPIADVTKQYMEYIDLMKELSLDLASEYLVMAAILAEIKSRMLLPRQTDPENPEADPRAELVRRLQEYERFKQAAEDIDRLERLERDNFTVEAGSDEISGEKPQPTVHLNEILKALGEVLKRAKLHAKHQVHIETLSVREKMTHILDQLQSQEHVEFIRLFNLEEGKLGVVVTFLGMLELLKQGLIDFVQASLFAPIYITHKANPTEALSTAQLTFA